MIFLILLVLLFSRRCGAGTAITIHTAMAITLLPLSVWSVHAV